MWLADYSCIEVVHLLSEVKALWTTSANLTCILYLLWVCTCLLLLLLLLVEQLLLQEEEGLELCELCLL